MKSRIFKGIFLVAILVWIACMILIMGALYMQYNGEYVRELKNEVYLVAHAVEQNGGDYFTDLKLAENHRITWIGQDGTVKYDSSVNPDKLENHGSRPEVLEAMETGYGCLLYTSPSPRD